MPESIPTSLRYNFNRFLLLDSINGKTGLEIAWTFKTIPELIK